MKHKATRPAGGRASSECSAERRAAEAAAPRGGPGARRGARRRLPTTLYLVHDAPDTDAHESFCEKNTRFFVADCTFC